MLGGFRIGMHGGLFDLPGSSVFRIWECLECLRIWLNMNGRESNRALYLARSGFGVAVSPEAVSPG